MLRRCPGYLRCIAVAVLAWTTAAVQAELPPLVQTSAGYWYLVSDDSGQPSLVRVDMVIRLTTVGVEPGPTAPHAPVPAPPAVVLDAAVVEQVRAATERLAKFDDAQRLGLVYDAMADHLTQETLTQANVFDAIVAATEATLTASNGLNSWQTWRQEVSRLTTRLTAEGKLGTPAAIRTYLKSVAQGLQDAVPDTFARLSLAEGVVVVSACSKIVEALNQ